MRERHRDGLRLAVGFPGFGGAPKLLAGRRRPQHHATRLQPQDSRAGGMDRHGPVRAGTARRAPDGGRRAFPAACPGSAGPSRSGATRNARRRRPKDHCARDRRDPCPVLHLFPGLDPAGDAVAGARHDQPDLGQHGGLRAADAFGRGPVPALPCPRGHGPAVCGGPFSQPARRRRRARAALRADRKRGGRDGPCPARPRSRAPISATARPPASGGSSRPAADWRSVPP